MQRIWYKDKVPGVIVSVKGDMVLVNLYCYGIWLHKYVNKFDITERTNTISPFVISERKQWFYNYNDRRNTPES